MSEGERQTETLRRLAAMPFLGRLELAAVSGLPDRSAYRAVAALERRGLAASLPHATDPLRPPAATTSPPKGCATWPRLRALPWTA